MAAGFTSLEESVEAKMSTLAGQQWKSQPFTIFRVPAYVRESDRTAYEPRTVSIGPYYHGAPALRAMEEHKWRYLHDFLCRSGTISSSILIEELRSMEARTRACYSESTALGSDDFVRMLLLDGCFILEFFFKWHDKEPDALCDVGWGLTFISSDLLLMENQIPFFIIERLYELVVSAQGGSTTRESLLDLLLEYISSERPIARPSCDKIHSLLHLYYESYEPRQLPQSPAQPNPATRLIPRAAEMCAAGVTFVRGLGKKPRNPATRLIPRAAEMSAAGVTFVPGGSSAGDMYNVTFDARSGVMEIPTIVVDDMKRTLIINLVALEQSQGVEEARMVTIYVSLMGMLIRTAKDVELLRQSNIVDNLLADDDEAARFFSHLLYGFAMDYKHQKFATLCNDVRRYCESWRHRNRATLMRDYFSSPWSAISMIVAAIVVALTATQTYFTIFPAQK